MNNNDFLDYVMPSGNELTEEELNLLYEQHGGEDE